MSIGSVGEGRGDLGVERCAVRDVGHAAILAARPDVPGRERVLGAHASQTTGSDATTRAARRAAISSASSGRARRGSRRSARRRARRVRAVQPPLTRTIGPHRRWVPKRACVHSGAKSLASTCSSWAKNGPGVDASARTPATRGRDEALLPLGRRALAEQRRRARRRELGVVGGAGRRRRRSVRRRRGRRASSADPATAPLVVAVDGEEQPAVAGAVEPVPGAQPGQVLVGRRARRLAGVVEGVVGVGVHVRRQHVDVHGLADAEALAGEQRQHDGLGDDDRGARVGVRLVGPHQLPGRSRGRRRASRTAPSPRRRTGTRRHRSPRRRTDASTAGRRPGRARP